MTQEEIILRYRIYLLLRAKPIKNISSAYRMFGVSRTIFYKYKQRYVTYGIEGLKDKERSTPIMSNATKAKVVDKVLEGGKEISNIQPGKACR